MLCERNDFSLMLQLQYVHLMWHLLYKSELLCPYCSCYISYIRSGLRNINLDTASTGLIVLHVFGRVVADN